MLELCDEFQVGTSQISCNPFVDTNVQLWAKMIFPIARFAWKKLCDI